MYNSEIVGRGMTTTIYRDGGVAVKLYLNARPENVYREADLQRFAYDAGLPVPAVRGVRVFGDGSVALDMDYIEGYPILGEDMNEGQIAESIRAMVKLQRRVHRIYAAGLPELTENLERRIINADAKYIDGAQKVKLLALLSRLENNSDNLCHGDFHPLNILFNGAGLWIIDWVDATAGDPLADACRTYLILKQHAPQISELYLQQFNNETGAAREDVLAWLPVLAAVRLDEKQDEKSRSLLLDFIRD